MRADKIRMIAICVFQRGGKILVAEGYDTIKQQHFYRPLGGTVEFGERSIDTVSREMKEEIDAEVTDLQYLGAIENIFIFEGQKGHELVQVYDGRFVDEALYNKKIINGIEEGAHFRASWLDISKLGPDSPPLYPTGLLDLLETSKTPA